MDNISKAPPSGAESPTTAKPLEFDDEIESGPIKLEENATVSPVKPGSGEDEIPPKPISKDLSPRQQAEQTLAEAFPSIDRAVVRAVLIASGGKVEPAFNALLAMSDPDAHQREPTPPPKPPRPNTLPASITSSTPLTQLEADELYARQLAEHYNAPSYRSSAQVHREIQPVLPRPKRETGLKPNELYDDREHSFLEDDLPIIKENIKQGFLQTQTKVNQWVESFRKKLDGEDSLYSAPEPSSAASSRPLYNAARQNDYAQRNSERDKDRYDADPRVLDDDFAGLELKDETVPPPKPTRPLANPDLFKTKSASSDTRRVSFQDPEVDDRPPTHVPRRNASPAAKTSKWEPLASMEPTSIPDNDPFSLGDSDDDKEKDLKSEDTERLKHGAATKIALSEHPVQSESGETPKPAETVGPAGTRDKDAEEL